MALSNWTMKFGDGWTLEAHAARFPNSVGDRTPPADGLDLSVRAVALVSGGAWRAVCPFGCNSSEYVNLDDPRFFCCECRNAATGHSPIPVTLPDDKTRSQVEAYLCVRPLPQQRNWYPDVTIKELRAENRARGLRLAKAAA